jgi:hypothetical protein
MANKAQFIDTLAHRTSLDATQAEEVTNALPEVFGEWLRSFGIAPQGGVYSGEIAGGLKFDMVRKQDPNRWELKITFTGNGLADFGDGTDRFGLTVVNA